MFDSVEDALDAFSKAADYPGVLAAQRIAEEARRQFPNSASIAALCTKALMWRGEHELAIVESNRALDLDPHDPHALAAGIEYCTVMGEFERGEELIASVSDEPLDLRLCAANCALLQPNRGAGARFALAHQDVGEMAGR